MIKCIPESEEPGTLLFGFTLALILVPILEKHMSEKKIKRHFALFTVNAIRQQHQSLVFPATATDKESDANRFNVF